MQSTDEHAIVLGASMAGLLAARVLADRFQRVSIIEHDGLSANNVPRRGVPQGQHIHVLLASGVDILERLSPGISGEVVADGGLSCEPTPEWRLAPCRGPDACSRAS